MKIVSTVLFMGILAVGLSPARGDDKKTETAAELKALDAKLTEAFESHDFEMLGKHTADDYILIDPRGRVHTKEKYLEHLSKSKANPKLAELKETDVKVRVFGDTAVVAGLLHVKAKVQDKDISAEYRWTRVYNKDGDTWQCVLEQHTHVLPKEEAK
ncbi:MAG: nuclear transport factor 2 family protein [Thermoguttaceae bacterium]